MMSKKVISKGNLVQNSNKTKRKLKNKKYQVIINNQKVLITLKPKQMLPVTKQQPKKLPISYHRSKKILATILKIIIISFAAFLIYVPIVVILFQSINGSKNNDVFTNFSLKWYGGLFNPEYFLNNDGHLSSSDIQAAKELQEAIFQTFTVTISSTIISTILGILFALGINALSRKKRQKMILLNNVPIVNADIVTAVTLMIIFQVFFSIFHIELGFISILISHIFFSLPYVVLSILPKLSEIDHNLYDAAVDLGCSPFKALLKVIIPAIKSGIIMGMLFAFTMSIDDFTISYFTGARLYSNVSCIIYLRKSKSLSPSVYAYNTILTFGILLVLVGYNIYVHLKNQKKKLKNNKE